MTTDKKLKKEEKKKKMKKNQVFEKFSNPPAEDDNNSNSNTKKNKKRKLNHHEHEDEQPLDQSNPRSKHSRSKRNNNKYSVVTDERFASVHSDPRFQRVPKKESKVPIDSRFARMLSDKSFGFSSAPVDKRGRPRKEKEVNPLRRYYHNEDGDNEEEKEEDEEIEAEVEEESSSSSSSDDDEEEDNDDEDMVLTDISPYLLAKHEDTQLTDQETHRLAVVNMDWDHIKVCKFSNSE